MSFTLIKIPAKPIVLLHTQLTELVESDQVASVKTRFRHMLNSDKPPLYVIWDLTNQEIMVYAIQLLIYDANESSEGSIGDPRIKTLIAGDHPVLEVLIRQVREQFGVTVWHFENTDDALAWASQQTTRQN